MKHLVQLVLFLAIFAQSMIPAGFMPGNAAAGTPVMICSGVEHKIVHVDDQGQPIDEQQDSSSCPYSVLPVASSAPIPDFIIQPEPKAVLLNVIGHDSIFITASVYRPTAHSPPTLF